MLASGETPTWASRGEKVTSGESEGSGVQPRPGPEQGAGERGSLVPGLQRRVTTRDGEGPPWGSGKGGRWAGGLEGKMGAGGAGGSVFLSPK